MGGGPSGTSRLSLPIKASLLSLSIILPPNPKPKNSSNTSILTSIFVSSSSPFSELSMSSILTWAEEDAPRTSEMVLNGSCLEDDMRGFTILILLEDKHCENVLRYFLWRTDGEWRYL